MTGIKFFFNRYLLWIVFLFYLLFSFFIKNPLQDVHLFESVGFYLTRKIDIYFIDQTHGTYPFFPFLIFPYALAHLIVERWPILPFSFLVKLILIPTIFALGILIEKISILQGLNKKSALQRKVLFCLNPVVFFTVVYHGQADIVLLFFFLLSFYLFKNTILSGIFYGVSILTKTWSVIFWPLLLLKFKNPKQFLAHLASTFLVIFFVCFIYTRYLGSSFTRVFEAVTGHPGGSAGYWGYTALLFLFAQTLNNVNLANLIQILFEHSILILLISFFLTYSIIILKKPSFLTSALLLVLVFYLATPSWGIQHSLWALPFLFLWSTKAGFSYSSIVTPYLFFGYLSFLNLPFDVTNLSRAFSLIPWAFSIKTFYEIIKNKQK